MVLYLSLPETVQPSCPCVVPPNSARCVASFPSGHRSVLFGVPHAVLCQFRHRVSPSSRSSRAGQPRHAVSSAASSAGAPDATSSSPLSVLCRLLLVLCLLVVVLVCLPRRRSIAISVATVPQAALNLQSGQLARCLAPAPSRRQCPCPRLPNLDSSSPLLHSRARLSTRCRPPPISVSRAELPRRPCARH